MKLLGIETSSSTGSIALSVDGDVVEHALPTPREQTQRLIELTAELLAQARLALADLDAIAFGRGPGSFTGLRVAAAVAQGFGVAGRVPLLPVSSLAALAQGALRNAGIDLALVCVDARMGEAYAGEFGVVDERMQPRGAETLSAPAAVVAPVGRWAALGDGFAAYPQLADLARAAMVVDPAAVPHARDLFPQAAADLAAGRITAAERALPVYLRPATAWRR